MKNMLLRCSLLLVLLVLIFDIQGQDINKDSSNRSPVQKKQYSSRFERSQLYIETDPSVLFLKGFSLQIRRSLFFKKRLIVGLGYYTATMPEFWINSLPSNKDKGWSAKVKHGADFYVDYHFTNPNRGLFSGLGLSVYKFQIRRNGAQSEFNSLIPNVRIGYLWRPFKNSLYILPVAGVAYYYTTLSGKNTIEGESLTIKKWSFVPTLNIGVSF